MIGKSPTPQPASLGKDEESTASLAPALDTLHARHGNSAVTRAALAGSSALAAAAPGGRGGLPGGVRSSMEAAFGRSFSAVRVSEGERVRPGQLAVTEGLNVDFAPGHFQPETPAGRFLLAHELTHVVQQQNGGGAAALAKSDGSRAPARPDLEREANDVAARVAGGGGGQVQVHGTVSPGEPVTLAFEAREHILAAWKAYQGWIRMGQFYIPWAFTVAMADLFENMGQAQKIAEEDPEQFEAVLSLQVAQPVPGRETAEDKKKQGKTEPPSIASEEPIDELAIHKEIGTDKTKYHPKLREAYGEIDELLKVAAVDPGQFRFASPQAAAAGPGEFRGRPAKPGKRKTEGDFSARVRDALKKRFYVLAKLNIEHYLNPELGDSDLSTRDKIAKGLDKDEKGEKRHPNAAGTYRENHEKAIRGAVEAGVTGKALDSALLFEGWAIHFLTDSFAGGHLRTIRRSAEDYWDKRAPLFYDNMKGYVAERLAQELDFLAPGARLALIRLALNSIFEDFPKLGAGLALNVALEHDRGNRFGVEALVEGRRMRLMGDSSVNQETMEQATKAVQVSRREIEQAHQRGVESKAAATDGTSFLNAVFNDVVRMLRKHDLYAAELLIPTVIRDEQLPAGDRSIPYGDHVSLDTLFKDPGFQQGVIRFLELKISNFRSILAGLNFIVRDLLKVGAALERSVLKEMKVDPAGMLWRILNWTPTFGGRAGEVGYLRDVAKSGHLEGLTKAQRLRLVKSLLSDWATPEEANLLRSLLLKAPPDEVREIIQRYGYERLAKVLGPNFGGLARE